jgi:hypothetical protein
MSNTTFQSIDTASIITTTQNFLTSVGVTSQLVGQIATNRVHSCSLLLPEFKFRDTTGSDITPRLFLKNANDGTSAFMIAVGAFRAVCSNGLVFGGHAEFSQRIIHRVGPKSSNFLMQLPEVLEISLQNIVDGSLADEVERLSDMPVTEELAIHIIGGLHIDDRVKRQAIRSIVLPPRPEDINNSVYSVLNVTNEALRRVQGGTLAYVNKNAKLADDIEALYLAA